MLEQGRGGPFSGDWVEFLSLGLSDEALDLLRRLEQMLGRLVRPGKPGPKGPWKHKQWKYFGSARHLGEDADDE